ncbi:hypothetical protein [Pseudoduganella sp. R-34]|uniref:hypothetical protein n=1 Tax=Pseudoduganella sp. R-34 TaxID=3404062 RepID=UPI003CF884D4
MKSMVIDCSRTCANDSTPREPEEPKCVPQAEQKSPTYASMVATPATVRFSIPIAGNNEPAGRKDQRTEAAPPQTEGARSSITKCKPAFSDRAANESSFARPTKVAEDSLLEPVVPDGRTPPTTSPDLPPTAVLLHMPARESVGDVAAPPVVAAEDQYLDQPHAGETAPNTDQGRKSTERHDNSKSTRRLKLLYAALVPAVIAVNFSIDGAREFVRDLVHTKEGVAVLQKQVAELKSAAPAQPAASSTVPPAIQQPIAVIPPEQAFESMPSPIPDRSRVPTPTAARKVQPVYVPELSTKQKDRAEKDDIPEPGQFVLSTDEKKNAPVVQQAAVPPANEFKLLGDK